MTAPLSPLLDAATTAIIESENTNFPMQRFVASRFAEAVLDSCHVEELTQAIRANDSLIRDIRHRDARWHDDELVVQLLDRNRALLAKLDGKPAEGAV